MMRKLLILGVMAGMGLLSGCGDDDDEFRLNEGDLTRKNWYYNNSRNQFGYENKDDVVEVLYFNVNHDLVEKEFAGRQETGRGTWSLEGNELRIAWSDDATDTWQVLACNGERLVVNGWGEREYVARGEWDDLTGDAYWVNEFEGVAGSEGFSTKLGFSLAGNQNVRDACVLLAETEDGRVWLERDGSTSVWKGQTERPNEDVRVRFSCRIGAGDYIKFDDEVTRNNFELLRWSDINPAYTSLENGVNVAWNPVRDEGVYYQVTIYEEGNETTPYFVSSLRDKANLNVTVNTMGVVNRLSKLRTDARCKARVSVIMLEEGVDPNDVYASCNLQAVLYATANGSFSNVF